VTETFHLKVNGVDQVVTADPQTSLLMVLRNQLNLYGVRFGCGLGQCGACVVQAQGNVMTSCDLPMSAVEGWTVVTVEGLSDRDGLHPVQQAVLDEQAGQCGYCLSGILVSAAALLERSPAPDEREVLEALDRHLCRCGVQRRVVRAVLAAHAPVT